MFCAAAKRLPLTSVILVSYHTGPDLFAAIDSVLKQDKPVEAVVVNNGNPDDVLDKLRRRIAADPRLSLVDGHGNVGFARGNNLGVKASRGEYVLILNPDCVLADDTVSKLHKHARLLGKKENGTPAFAGVTRNQNGAAAPFMIGTPARACPVPGCGTGVTVNQNESSCQTHFYGPPFMIGARILNRDGSDQRGCRRQLLTPASAFVEALHLTRFFPKHRLNLHEGPVPAALSGIPAISGAFMFLSRDDYDKIGGFDEGYFLHVEDLDFCYRFRKAKGEIYFAPDVPVTHIGSTSDVTSDFIEKHKTRGFSRYFHKNFSEEYPRWFLRFLDFAIWSRYTLRRLARRHPKVKHT